ncbi:MAG: flavodoxin family protein [Promethearchaeati archaeon SRVP18_Atabeyarchaeia-1]
MKACGMIGSPKKDGNVDQLASQVLRGMNSVGIESDKIYLNDLRIRACQSCGVDPSPKFCIFDDDMKKIYDALDSCDAIVLGSPVYFDTVSAQVKLMIDRCNCLMPYLEKPDGSWGFVRRIAKRKKGVFIAAAGVDQEYESILTTVKGFFQWANIELIETVLYSHDDTDMGGVKTNKEKMGQAYEVGFRLGNSLSTRSDLPVCHRKT